jgi:hypothetical protein
MTKHFMKTKSCGCVVYTSVVGIKRINDKIYYMLGGHDHIKICEKCNEQEVNDIDTLHDMWMNDNMTDGTENDKWKECSYITNNIDKN